MADREAKIRQFETRYAEVILHILAMEDPRYPGVNHYRKLCGMVSQQRNASPTDDEVAAEIRKAALELAASFLQSGDSFGHFHSGDLFEQVAAILHDPPTGKG